MMARLEESPVVCRWFDWFVRLRHLLLGRVRVIGDSTAYALDDPT